VEPQAEFNLMAVIYIYVSPDKLVWYVGYILSYYKTVVCVWNRVSSYILPLGKIFPSAPNVMECH